MCQLNLGTSASYWSRLSSFNYKCACNANEQPQRTLKSFVFAVLPAQIGEDNSSLKSHDAVFTVGGNAAGLERIAFNLAFRQMKLSCTRGSR